MYWKDSHETFVENAPSSDGKEKDHSYNHWALFNNNTYKDIYLKPRKFHIDHVLDRKHGGPTTLDNAELMRAKDNLAKGATANEQPFRGEDVGFNREDDE